MKPTGRATIADVAEAAGVSKATVSRFLNHRERLLSPDIAARVEVAVAKLAYSPSPMAQALSHGRSRLIGLIVADQARAAVAQRLRHQAAFGNGHLDAAMSGLSKRSRWLRKRETVALETPAASATSAMVARPVGFMVLLFPLRGRSGWGQTERSIGHAAGPHPCPSPEGEENVARVMRWPCRKARSASGPPAASAGWSWPVRPGVAPSRAWPSRCAAAASRAGGCAAASRPTAALSRTRRGRRRRRVPW